MVIVGAAATGENNIAAYVMCAVVAIVLLSFAMRFPRGAWDWRSRNPGVRYPSRRKFGWAAALAVPVLGSVAVDSAVHPEHYEDASATAEFAEEGRDGSLPQEPSSPTLESAISGRSEVSSPPTDNPADWYDCAEPSVEVITFDWRMPSRGLHLGAPPGVLFASGDMRIRITNNSRPKIATSGASFDLAWRGEDGAVYIMTELMSSALAWMEVPWRSVMYAPTETVGGHDAIEFTENFGDLVHATDGSEPWVNQSKIGWHFDSPEIRELCDEQFARLGRNAGPP